MRNAGLTVERVALEALQVNNMNYVNPDILDQEIDVEIDFDAAQKAVDVFYQEHPEISNNKHFWIQTFTGKKFNLFEFTPSSICIEDIAHALSMICRFGGHAKRFISVAEHSILVSYFCNREDALAGLLHDASEAYLGDVSSPFKRTHIYSKYKEIESELQDMIYSKYGILKEPSSVKKADLMMLATESKEFMSPVHPDWKCEYEPIPIKIIGMSPDQAKQAFLDRFRELHE